MLRDQFTVVRWFYNGEAPSAVQHGLRLTVLGTGSVGRFSLGQLATSLAVCLAGFGAAQSILDLAWFYFHPRARDLAAVAYRPVTLDHPQEEEEATTAVAAAAAAAAAVGAVATAVAAAKAAAGNSGDETKKKN